MTQLATETITLTHGPETLTFDPYISAEVVDARIQVIADHLGPLLSAVPQGELVVVPVLNGGWQMMSPTLEAINNPRLAPDIQPIKVRSYNGTESGELTLEQDAPPGAFAGKDVVVCDEVIDFGTTLKYLLDQRILPEEPRSLTVVSLFSKPQNHPGLDLRNAFVGFNVPPYFLLGRGMDWHNMGRFLRDIWFVPPTEDPTNAGQPQMPRLPESLNYL